MRLVFILVVLCIGGTFIWCATVVALRSKQDKGAKKWLKAVGGILLALGGFGFFATLLSASGGLPWLPARFEWPVGIVGGIVMMPDGMQVVPHTPSGRIQVYDRDWNFLRGWHVDASGGVFVLRPAGPNQIEVITARGQMRYVYSLDGSLLSREGYAPRSYSDFPASGFFAAVPTRWWLWMFTSPFYCGAIIGIGMVLLYLAGRKKAKRRRAA
jgi:hypothetical protein